MVLHEALQHLVAKLFTSAVHLSIALPISLSYLMSLSLYLLTNPSLIHSSDLQQLLLPIRQLCRQKQSYSIVRMWLVFVELWIQGKEFVVDDDSE